MQQVVYLSHAISAPHEIGGKVWLDHIEDVGKWAEGVVKLGFAVIVPHVLPGLTHRTAMRQDHTLVDLSDFVLVHDSKWTQESSGVRQEIRWARELGKPVLRSIEELKAHK